MKIAEAVRGGALRAAAAALSALACLEKAAAPLAGRSKALRWSANAMAFAGAWMIADPAKAAGLAPALLFAGVHLLWAASSLSTSDRESLGLNVALMPFDVWGLHARLAVGG